MSRKIKPTILFVEQHAFLGGGQRIIVSIATHPMITEQWKVEFALPEDGPLNELLSQASISVLRYPGAPMRDGRKTFRDLLLYVRNFLNLVAWFRQTSKANDVKFIYTSSPRYLLPMLCAILGLPTRIVFHLHHFYSRRSYEWFFKLALLHPKVMKVICPSHAAEQWLRAITGPLPKIVQVSNWICTEMPILKASPDACAPVILKSESPNSFWFAVIGRIDPIKGQDLFLEAAKRLIDLGVNAEFYVIGGSAFTDQPEFETNLIKRYKSELRIHFVGHTEAISEIYPQIGCVVVPSRYEVFGMTAVEAMYYGVPVIVSDFGELPRIVEFGKSGAVFRGGSVDALFDAMSKIYYDPQYRQTLIENAGIRVRANYLPETGIARIRAVLN